MSLVIAKDRVELKPAANPKDACVGCLYEEKDQACPTVKKDAWTALLCEINGAVNFQKA